MSSFYRLQNNSIILILTFLTFISFGIKEDIRQYAAIEYYANDTHLDSMIRKKALIVVAHFH